MEGLKMISKARKYRGGGGVCIIGDIPKISITPLEMPSDNLEIVGALIKPLQQSIINEIIAFSFYLSPKSRMKSKMTGHIVTSLHQLLTTYLPEGWNNGRRRLECLARHSCCPQAPQPTTASYLKWQEPQHIYVQYVSILFHPSDSVTYPAWWYSQGEEWGPQRAHHLPSGHHHTGKEERVCWEIKSARPLPDSGLRAFGQLIINEKWEDINDQDWTTRQDKALQTVLLRMLDKSCPVKMVRLRTEHKPYMTKENV